jgi:hypothetical protein
VVPINSTTPKMGNQSAMRRNDSLLVWVIEERSTACSPQRMLKGK